MSYYSDLMKMQKASNNLARANADRANNFTWKSQMEAQRYNSNEALKNRQFQLNMSNTSHQREVRDLMKAGLNPVLSANNGAAVSSGAAGSISGSVGTKADLDMQAEALYSQYRLNKMNNAMSLKINKLNNANSKELARIAAAASMYGANAGVTAAGISASAARDVAWLNYQNSEAQRQFDEEHNPYSFITGQLSSLYNELLGDGSLVQKGKQWFDKAGNFIGDTKASVIKWLKDFQKKGNRNKSSSSAS